MNSPNPVPESPAETPPPMPLPDRLMLYLFFSLFLLFAAILLGDLIYGMFR